MKSRQLGKSDLKITSIGIGAWAMGGGKWEFAWGQQEDEKSIAAIHTGLDLGINWIDTAAVYGLGHSETVVGRAVRGLRARPYIFTKCSLVWDKSGTISHNLQASSLKQECEASLKRLGIDAIDLYQIHWPAWKGAPESDSPGSIEEAVAALAKLKEQGKIRNIGVSNFDAEQMRRAQMVAPIASLQPPYSLVAPEVESTILPYARSQKIGVIMYSPMGSGLLTGAMTRQRIAALPEDDWRRGNPNFQEPLLSRNLELVETLRAIGQRRGRSPGEVAIAWTLKNPAVTAAIVGVRSAEQVQGIVGAAGVKLTPSEIAEIENHRLQDAA
ncbi:MAG TPA: aldo/keto reductase [Bryobacteraceae bacterium]|jgi:aryl-alcohol dehydrogenase-like predicted oxidoreductase|nr:aldo/keto reductase [Bryobacteraceae bacterium]